MKHSAIHVLWSFPKVKNNFKPLENFELSILYLSVSLFKKKNVDFSLTLYTDDIGKRFLEKKNLANLWDQIDVNLLNRLTKKREGCSGFCFNEGKSIVLSQAKMPFLFIDNDAIFNRKIEKESLSKKVLFAHLEKSDEDEKDRGIELYPTSKEIYQYSDSFRFLNKYDWSIKESSNSALLYLNSKKVQETYKEELENYLERLVLSNGFKKQQILLLDQRLIDLTSRFHNISPEYFLEKIWDYNKGVWKGKKELDFHHTWFLKKEIKKSENMQIEYIQNIVRRFEKDLTDEEKQFVLNLLD